MARAIYYHQITGGAFDITVKPLIDLFETRFRAGKEPSRHEIKKVLSATGMEHIRFDGESLRLARKNMGITLDGIAKGYIVDCASRLLKEKSVSNHLINAGGDIRTSGMASGNNPWTIALQDPANKSGRKSVLQVGSGAVATSGNYEVYYDQEKVFHHIVDTSTGCSPTRFASVTVKAPTVMEADALSTSIFVMPPDVGLGLINRLTDCECFCITENDRCFNSKGWVTIG